MSVTYHQLQAAQNDTRVYEELRRSTSRELERISIASITTFNVRDWSFASPEGKLYLNSVAQGFKCWLSDGGPEELDFDQLWDRMHARCEDFPDSKVDIAAISSDVDLKSGEAVVHMVIELRGLTRSDGLVIHGGNEFKWKLQAVKGTKHMRWMLVKVFGIRACIGDEGVLR